MANIDPSVKAAYENIRKSDNSDTWVILQYEGSKITVQQTGNGIDDFVAHLSDNEAQYGYLRVNITVEEATRLKFVFISWIGEYLSPLKKGRISVDKTGLKTVIRDFAIELAASDKEDLSEDKILGKLRAANY